MRACCRAPLLPARWKAMLATEPVRRECADGGGQAPEVPGRVLVHHVQGSFRPPAVEDLRAGGWVKPMAS